MSCPAGYFACHYNECEHMTIAARQIRAEIDRLEHSLALDRNALFNANPRDQQTILEFIEVQEIEVQHRYEDLEEEERKMFHGSDTTDELTAKVRIANEWHQRDQETAKQRSKE